MRVIWTALPLLILAIAAAALWRDRGGPQAAGTTLTCADLAKGCAVHLPGRAASIGLGGDVRPLKPFQVWVKAPGAHSVQAQFTMPGMDMGFNIYTLHADADGVFRSSVTLPMCVSGRRDWIVAVDIDGAKLNVPFSTDL